MLFRRIVLAAAASAATGLGFPAEAGEPNGPLAGFATSRTWSDSSGNFQIEASLTYADSKKARIKKSDGRVVTVPLDKLASTDRAFVKAFLSAETALGPANGAPADSANPFAGGEVGGAGSAMPTPDVAADSNAGPSATGGSIPEKRAITQGFRPLTIKAQDSFWSAKAPVGFPEVSFEDIVLQTPLPKPFFASMQIRSAGASGTIVLNSYREKRGKDAAYGNFVIASASSGRASRVFEFAEPWKLMAISPDGGRIAAVQVVGFDKGNDVAVFRIDGLQLVPEFRFTAGGGSWDELHWVGFLPNNRLATISQKHNLTFWDLNNPVGPKAVRRGSTGSSLHAVLTKAGELMALIAGSSIAVLDTNSGQTVGFINGEEKIHKIAFSPDGSMLAAYDPFTIAVYSTSDGSEVRQFAISESSSNAPVFWVGEHLMVGAVLYDVKRGVPLWTYETRANQKSSLGSYLISCFGRDENSVVSVLRVPDQQAMRAMREVTPEQIYAIVPGDSVAVKYDFGSTPSKQKGEIEAAVNAKLEDLGWQVRSGAPNVVKISMEQGERKEAEYYESRGGPGPRFIPHMFGRPSGPKRTVNYRPWTHRIEITAGGEAVFTSALTRSAPSNLQLKEGETTQQAVNRICQPQPSYFKNIAIPPSVLKKQYQGGFGKSTIGPNGVQ